MPSYCKIPPSISQLTRGEEKPYFQKQNKAFHWASINSGTLFRNINLNQKRQMQKL